MDCVLEMYQAYIYISMYKVIYMYLKQQMAVFLFHASVAVLPDDLSNVPYAIMWNVCVC